MGIDQLFNLEGKMALVTGGTHGIGMASAMALGQAGARVCVNGRDPGKLEKAKTQYAEAGLDVHTPVFDVTDSNDVDRGEHRIRRC